MHFRLVKNPFWTFYVKKLPSAASFAKNFGPRCDIGKCLGQFSNAANIFCNWTNTFHAWTNTFYNFTNIFSIWIPLPPLRWLLAPGVPIFGSVFKIHSTDWITLLCKRIGIQFEEMRNRMKYSFCPILGYFHVLLSQPRPSRILNWKSSLFNPEHWW